MFSLSKPMGVLTSGLIMPTRAGKRAWQGRESPEEGQNQLGSTLSFDCSPINAGKGFVLFVPGKGKKRRDDQVTLRVCPMPRTVKAETSRPERINDIEAPAGNEPPVSGSIEPSDSPVHSFTQMPTQ